ncbi:lysophospholipid acyltransferase LPEAT1-like isoform X2 [Rhodamnia argentea]|uniref:Lysophospholipid acyltransferase LPEAT1-like isoform X2 n=1 Tax=Rhodamnia argentea TaxID=178133 RepID=A0ABM3H2F4_9MYRT|nr:lysophospholipid acyltransferase LPEAT1-like isoform X2 [Rhodamnia argentea]
MEPDLEHPVIDTKPPCDELERKFAPFVRHDVYGPRGRGDPPLAEKVLLGLALVTIVPVRVVVGVSLALFYYSICRVCTLGLEPHREDDQEDYAHVGGWRRAVIVYSRRFLSRVMFFTLGFYRIRERRCGPRILKSGDGERSVAELPIVGLVSKCLGCIYVQRESKALDFRGVAGIVAKRVQEAHVNKDAPVVMLFPEGTTTNGEFLLPFKTGAFLSNAPVLPVILRYPYERFSPAWDSISGVRHLIFLLCQFVNHLEVTYLPLYYPSKQEQDDPKLYADNVRRLMAVMGNLMLSDSGLAEKRIYHAALNGNCMQKDD